MRARGCRILGRPRFTCHGRPWTLFPLGASLGDDGIIRLTSLVLSRLSLDFARLTLHFAASHKSSIHSSSFSKLYFLCFDFVPFTSLLILFWEIRNHPWGRVRDNIEVVLKNEKLWKMKKLYLVNLSLYFTKFNQILEKQYNNIFCNISNSNIKILRFNSP